MELLIFIIVYPIIWLISILPFPILYLISDFFFLITYYVIGYRKKVVYNNLKTAFPEKSDSELKKLTKKTIQHFTDFIFETIKGFTISKKSIEKRLLYSNFEVFRELEKHNKGIIMMGSHYGNWEWMMHIAKDTKLTSIAAYSKIGNKYFEKAIKKSRERFGANFIRSNKIIPTIHELKKEGKLGLFGLLSDQSPSFSKIHYWGSFFDQKVPVITGSEFLAKNHDLIVVNLLTTRLKRGYYSTRIEVITTNAKETKEHEITNKYMRSIEKHIAKAPEFYLWTHKRFKHAGKYTQWLEIKNKKN